MNVSAECKGDKVILTIDVSKDTLANPHISKSEAAKAADKGRQPEARQIASTGGFVQVGPVEVSLNAMLA